MHRAVGEPAGSVTKQNEETRDRAKNTLKLAVTALALLLVVSLVLVVFEHINALSLQSVIRERDNALAERGKVIKWLATALNLTQLTLKLKPPNASQYLRTLPDSNNQGKPTKIYLVSTTPGYSYVPYTWPFNAELRNKLMVPTDNGSISLPDFGWWHLPGNYSFAINFGENPVLMIGVTIRNDYTTEDAENGANPKAPIGINPFTNRSSSWISLTVKFYSWNGDIIQVASANITQATTVIGSQKFVLGSGETTQVVFYFSPPSQDVDHYEVYVSYLSPNW